MEKTFLDDCVSIREYAKLRGVSRPTAYNYVERGLPVFSAFGRMLIHIPTANAWMQARTKSKNKPRKQKQAEVAVAI